MFRKYGPGSEINFGYHNFNQFQSVYLENLKEGKTLKDIISSWAKAFYYSNNPLWPDYEPLIFVDKRPLENEICAKKLLTEFSRAKFIHLVRHPRGRYASVKKRQIHSPIVCSMAKRLFSEKITKMLALDRLKYVNYLNETDFVTSFCSSSLLSMKLALENERKIGKDKYLVIRYEDLVQDRKMVMEKVRMFLKIK